ncbi:MAG: MOSC domain-containing protein [Chloroflexota bacterium]|nr:MOSC domain-containing protein [Chloroflexota bacterium]
MTTTPTASIQQINASDGGVPKTPLDVADVTELGITVDRQRNTKAHGGPDRALCLFSGDVIETLRAEGHPIGPGDAGENMTLRGLDWAAVGPGSRLRLGESVLVEVTRYTTPCGHVAQFFRDGDFLQISQDEHPGRSRVYARVLATGRLRPGDPVEVLPPNGG